MRTCPIKRHCQASCVVVLLVCVSCINGTGGEPTLPAPEAPELSAAERNAIMAAVQAVEVLTETVLITRSIAGFEDQITNGEMPATVTFGDCPSIQMTLQAVDPPMYDVQADFGAGCAAGGPQNNLCAGNAGGTFDPAGPLLTIKLGGLTCNGKTLGGWADVTYDRSASTIAVEGDWGLTYVDGTTSVGVNVQGTGFFDRTAQTTTVSAANGRILRGATLWDISMNNLRISFAAQNSFVPAGGTISLSGDTIRNLRVRFGGNSAGTGVVDISVDNGEFLPVGL